MEKQLTITEEEFLRHLKRELFFSRIEIRTKVALETLCQERSDLNISFGREEALIRDIVIDFVLYRNDRAIAGIEIVDEPDEFLSQQGEKLLKDFIFGRLGCEFFRVVDLKNLKKAAHIIKEKVRNRKDE